MKAIILASCRVAAVLLAATPALALAATEACPGLVARRAASVIPAALAKDEVSITFVGHSTFVIESPTGVRACDGLQ